MPETIWSNSSNPSSPNMSANYRSVLDKVDNDVASLLGSKRENRSFSFSDTGEFESNLFDFKSSLAHVSYAASTGGPHTLAAPTPSSSKPPPFPLGTASISGGIASRHPPQDSFLQKFSAVADATKEIELTNTLSSFSLDNNEHHRRTSFTSDSNQGKFTPHGSMNENLNISSRNSRHQSISEKIDNYNNSSPIPSTAALVNPEPSPVSDKHQNHQGFWNPATATSFTPHQNFNYFLDGGMAPPLQPAGGVPQQAYPKSGPVFPPMSPPFFMMGGPPPFADGAVYGMPYGAPDAPGPAGDDSELATPPTETGSKKSPDQDPASPQKGGALPGIGLMNRGPQQPGFMFQPFNPYSMYGAGPASPPPSNVPAPKKSTTPKQNDSKARGKGPQYSPAPGGRSSGVSPNPATNSGKKFKQGRGASNGNGKSGHHIYRSPLLEEVRSNSKGKDYFLKDIYGHIVEFTKDQHGSRFIQQKLPSASEEEREVAFNEIREIAPELMTDVFGNYVIQKFFEHGSDTQKEVLLSCMTGNIYELSLQMYGCRVVQRALEYIHLDGQKLIVNELRDYVLICAKDQNGNHVIQKSIEKIPFDDIRFILDSLSSHIYHLSTHPYGCRVIQRLLEYSDPKDQQEILAELKRFIFYLIQDQYGNYVIQHILEHGDREDQEEILKVALSSIVNFSKHKFASNVIEKCIKHGTLEQRQRILAEVMMGNESLEKENVEDDSPLALMMKDQYANYVIQKLVEGFDPKSPEKKKLVVKLRQYLKQLSMKNSYGKHLASVEKMIVVAETALVDADRV